MKTALIMLLAVLVFAAPASAHTVLVGSDSPTEALYQGFIDRAMVPTADTRATLSLTSCPETSATWCSNVHHGPLVIYTGDDAGYLWHGAEYSDGDRLATQLTLLHEVGHVFDFSPGSKTYRKAFMRIMRYRAKDTAGEPPTWDYAQLSDANATEVTPFEQFAMAYGFCAMYAHYTDAAFARTVWWGYDYNPTPEQYERVCYVIRHARDGAAR